MASGSASVTSRLVRITAKRVAQLVGCLVDELALALERVVDAAEHVVERVGQLLELVVGAPRSMRRVRSVAWMSRATSVMRPIGRSTRPATDQPTPRLATKNIEQSEPNE